MRHIADELLVQTTRATRLRIATVRVCRDVLPGGSTFDRSWSFSVVRSGPGMSLTINQPAADQAVGMNFTVQGSTSANAKVNVTAGPGGAPIGTLRRKHDGRTEGQLPSERSLRAMPGLQAITLKVTATDPDTSQVSQQTLQLRVR